jgi:hypothetical protein
VSAKTGNVMRWLPITACLVFASVPASSASSLAPASGSETRGSSRSSAAAPWSFSPPCSRIYSQYHPASSDHLALRDTWLARTHASVLPVGLRKSSLTAVPGPDSPQSTAASGSSSKVSASASTKKKSRRKSRANRREPTQKAPTADRISEIQSALARGGYYKGDPSGKWDADTVGALQKFQSAHGLEPSGKLDATSLQKLGLGSGIAGVSAPKPVVPRSTSPATTSSPAPAGATAPEPISAPSRSSSSSGAGSDSSSPSGSTPNR